MVSARRTAALVSAVLALASLLAVSAPAAAQQPSPLCDASGVDQFSDVAEGDYAAAYILCAKALGLTKGASDSNFDPEGKLSRAQMAAFLARLWRDVLGRDCPAGSHPFSDIASDHWASADIACLYALGVTKGTTATSFSPSRDLNTAAVTRFVARLLNKAKPGSCDLTGDELARASACLSRLNIAPNRVEAEATDATPRAQMAVYLIGAWHHATDRGHPSQPPTRPPTTTDGGPATGTLTVKFHVCTTAEYKSAFTNKFIDDYVEALNKHVAPFYAWQSSGKLTVIFEPGQVLEAAYEGAGGLANTSCENQVDAFDSPYKSPYGVAHHFFNYRTYFAKYDHSGGRGQINGPVSWSSATADFPPGANLFVVQHELDHNIGVRHLNATYRGPTRVDVGDQTVVEGRSMATVDHVLSISPWGSHPSLRLFACHVVEEFGWPVGSGAAPCARYAPPPVTDVRIEHTGDGRTALRWTASDSSYNPEPVTGYRIQLFDVNAAGSGQDALHTWTVSADSTELVLNYQAGVYEALVFVTSAAGDRYVGVPSFAIGSAVRAVPRTYESPTWLSGVLYPIVYNVSWDPVPNATHYKVRLPGLSTETTEPRILLHEKSVWMEEGYRSLAEGVTYTVNVAACWSDSCGHYGSVTFTAVRFR